MASNPDAVPAEADVQPTGEDSAPQTPSVFRTALRSLVAGPATELAVGCLVYVWWTRGQAGPSAGLALSSLGFGLGLGAAFGLAESLSYRAGRLVGLAAGLLASPLAPLGGRFGLEMAGRPRSLEATETAVLSFSKADDGTILSLASGALLVFGALLWARRSGSSPLVQMAVMASGALVWCGASALLPPTSLLTDVALLGLFLRVPLYPAFLTFGDWLARRVLQRLARADPTPAAPPTAGRLRRVVLPALVLLATWAAVGAGLLRGRGISATELTLRLEAHGTDDPEGLFELGLAIARSGSASEPAVVLWTPGKVFGHAPYLSPNASPRVLVQRRHDERRRRLLQAVRYLERAGNQGFVPAMLKLAEIYGSGSLSESTDVFHSTIADRDGRISCVTWLRRAAETGDLGAAYRLSRRLRHGFRSSSWSKSIPNYVGDTEEEREQLSEEGRRWLRYAAERGHREAMRSLARRLNRSSDTQDELEAIAWYRELARLGDEDASTSLFYLLRQHPEERTVEDDRWLTVFSSESGYASSWTAESAPFQELGPVLAPEVAPAQRAPNARERRVLDAMEQGRLAEGRARAVEVLSADPSNAWANNAMAYYYLTKGLERERLYLSFVDVAASYLERAKAAEPRHFQTRVHLAICDSLVSLLAGPGFPAHDGDEDPWRARRAVEGFLLAKELNPRCAGIAEARLAAFLRVGRFEAWGIEELPTLEDAKRRLAREYASAGQDELARGNAEGAVADLTRAIELGLARTQEGGWPTLAEAHGSRGWAFARLGRTEEAISDYTAALDIGSPTPAWAYSQRGRLRVLLGRWGAGEGDLRRAVELEPEDPYHALWLAAVSGDPAALDVVETPEDWREPVVRLCRGQLEPAEAVRRIRAQSRPSAEAERASIGRRPPLEARLGLARCLAGVIAERRDDWEAAVEHYRAAAGAELEGWVPYHWAKARLAEHPAER